MIDLEKALADQANLGRLCAQKRIKYPEFYWPNSNYGFSTVLKTYAEYPLEQPVWGLVPHGVYLDESHIFPGEIEVPLRAVFSFPEYRDEAWAEQTDKAVIPAAAPFLYALALMREAGWNLPDSRRGTICAPLHSTAAVETDTKWARLAEELAALPEEYQPVTVCMHWQDLARGREREFARRGMRVVSAGHFSDQEFLFRLIHLMSQHRFAASNGVASNLFYAVSMGLPYFLVGRQPTSKMARGAEHLRHQYNLGSEEGRRRVGTIRPLFERLEGEPALEPTEDQRELSASYLGAERFKTPEGLRADLEFARNLHGR